MAATPAGSAGKTYIRDMSEALRAGTVPGSFDPERTVFTFPEVETENSRGGRQVWTAEVRLLRDGAPVRIEPEYLAQPVPGLPGDVGEITTLSRNIGADGLAGPPRAGARPTRVAKGKNLGKANATNVITQALRDAFSLYNKMRRRASPAAAAAPGEGAPEADAPEVGESPGPLQPPPMLLQKIDQTRGGTLGPAEFERGITAQRKLNGVRLVVYLGGDGRVMFYSRTSVNYPAPPHLAAELARFLAPPLPGLDRAEPGTDAGAPYLDGELYLHGKSLNWITGQAHREVKSQDELLEFHNFDVFFPALKAAGSDLSSAERQAYLDALHAREVKKEAPHVIRVENRRVKSRAELDAFMDEALAEGYEGVVARKDWAPYRYSYNNYHGNAVVKVKPIYDSEFTVVGYTQGRKGKAVGTVIWIAEVDPEHVVDPADKTFNVTPKDLSEDESRTIYQCLGEIVRPESPGGTPALTRFDRDFRGRPLTVEYPERSAKTGKPVQAKALTFRTYEGGPQADPVRRLFEECPLA